jgi:FkbM family methyltransferase
MPRPIQRTLGWRWNEWRGNTSFEPLPGWRLLCPRNAVKHSFWFATHDPPQQAELQAFIAEVRRQGTPQFVDVGCHFGLFTVAAAHFGGPATRVLAVDAAPLAGEMVMRLARLNGFGERIVFRHAAVGAVSGEIEMVEGDFRRPGYMLMPETDAARLRHRIALRTLDQIVSEAGWWPTLVKIDVEGHEDEVIAGGQLTLARPDVTLCFELHNEMLRARRANPGVLLGQLRALGFVRFECGGQAVAVEQLAALPLVRFIARKE